MNHIPFNDLVAANIVGLFLYPLVWIQHRKTKNKKTFLWTGILASVVFALSFWLTDQNTAMVIALVSGIAGMAQIKLRKKTPTVRAVFALLSIGVVFLLSPPDNYISWLAFGIFAWVRFAETMPDLWMRIAYLPHPILWAYISYLTGNYSLIPVDIATMTFLGMHLFSEITSRNARSIDTHLDLDLKQTLATSNQ